MFARPAAYYSASRRNEPTRHLSGKRWFDVLQQLEFWRSCQLSKTRRWRCSMAAR